MKYLILRILIFQKLTIMSMLFLKFHSMYKLNLIRNQKWVGTKLCFFVLKTPQWLRSLKVHKRYKFFKDLINIFPKLITINLN